MNRRNHHRPTGATLLEVLVAVGLSATLGASSFVVLRSTYAAWSAHEADLVAAGEAAAVLRHIVQHVRQSDSVTSVSAAADTSGHLAVISEGGQTWRWDHSGDVVTLAVDGAAAQPISEGIAQFRMIGFEADGVTPTTVPSRVHAVLVTVAANQPLGGVRTVSSNVWLRSW